MKKRMVLLLPALSLAVCLLGGCGGAASASVIPEPEPTAAPTAEPTPSPEPEPVPYAEEHALQFAPAEDFSVPSVMWVTDDLSQFREFEAPYHFDGVELTDNGDGTETLSVSYTITGMLSTFLNGPTYNTFYVFALEPWDMYTGLDLQSSFEGDFISEIEWKGEPYTIATHTDTSFHWGEWQVNADGTQADEYGYQESVQYVTYPKGYDGLAFFAAPCPEPPEGPLDRGLILDNWTDGTVLIRASDLIAACAAG